MNKSKYNKTLLELNINFLIYTTFWLIFEGQLQLENDPFLRFPLKEIGKFPYL